MTISAAAERTSTPRAGDVKNGAVSAMRAQIFDNRIPEFAQSQWLACKRAAPWIEPQMQQAIRDRKFYTYAVQENGRTLALYFLRRQKNRIVVLNGDRSAQGVALFRFTRFVFDRFPQVREIRFLASQRYACSPSRFGRRQAAERRLILPEHAVPQLEEALRFNKRNIDYFLQRLAQDFPDHRFEILRDEAIDEASARALLSLPRLTTSGEDDAHSSRAQADLLREIRAGGLLCTLTIQGKVVAGLICQRLGQNLYLRFLAHDPRMQAYGLNMLCCYFAACDRLQRHRDSKRYIVDRPRYRREVTVQRQTFAALCIRRPRVSWLVRCDVALYCMSRDALQHYRIFRDDCRQLGDSLVRLMSAWKLIFPRLKNRRLQAARGTLLPAFLRGH